MGGLAGGTAVGAKQPQSGALLWRIHAVSGGAAVAKEDRHFAPPQVALRRGVRGWLGGEARGTGAAARATTSCERAIRRSCSSSAEGALAPEPRPQLGAVGWLFVLEAEGAGIDAAAAEGSRSPPFPLPPWLGGEVRATGRAAPAARHAVRVLHRRVSGIRNSGTLKESSSMTRTEYPDGPRISIPLALLAQVLPGVFRFDSLSFTLNVSREYGDIAYYRFGPLHVYHLCHPDLARQILVEQSEKYRKPELLKHAFGPFAGEGLLISEGAVWKRQRKLMQPAFHHRQLAAYGKLMVAQTLRLLDD